MNMSYCRFTNTRADMSDCLDALYGEVPLSESEAKAARNMFLDILEFCEDRGLIASYDKDEVNTYFSNLQEKPEDDE